MFGKRHGKKTVYERGTMKHFLEYAVAECGKGIKLADLDINDYHSFYFTPPDNEYIFRYDPSCFSRRLSFRLDMVEENGLRNPLKTLFYLLYDHDREEFVSRSHYGSNFEGEKVMDAYVEDAVYNLVSSETVLCILAEKDDGKERQLFHVKKYLDKIQWQGTDCYTKARNDPNFSHIGGTLVHDEYRHLFTNKK